MTAFGCFFGREMHGIVGGAQFEMELQFAFEEVAGAVGTVFVLYFWVRWGIVWVGGIVLHDGFYLLSSLC